MTPETKDYFTTTVHKICVSNFTKDKFLSATTTGVRWTDNFNFASCFESQDEVFAFTERDYVQQVIGDELELYIWTDTRKSIFENN